MTNNIQFSSVCGIDIAKSVMQVYKVTSDGVVSNKAVKRADFLNYSSCSDRNGSLRRLTTLGT